MMMKKVEESFSTSYLAQFDTFEAVVDSKDNTSNVGLR